LGQSLSQGILAKHNSQQRLHLASDPYVSLAVSPILGPNAVVFKEHGGEHLAGPDMDNHRPVFHQIPFPMILEIPIQDLLQ
jgi:hypothetical protein